MTTFEENKFTIYSSHENVLGLLQCLATYLGKTRYKTKTFLCKIEIFKTICIWYTQAEKSTK